jgi:hypothetical protein
MKTSVIILLSLVNLVVFATLIFRSLSAASLPTTLVQIITDKPQQHNSKHRIAVLIPFIGDGPESIPPYLNLFVTAAAGSSSLVDFYIFHNGVLDYFYHDLPSNVKIISMGSIEGMMRQFVRVVDQRHDDFQLESEEMLVKILSQHLVRFPYVLVEFKPALAHIFASYLKGGTYTHWAYSDIDIVFGDLTNWITKEELEDFDLVTYGFGDADRAYLRGQFTIHRNDPEIINQLWRDCEYLSKMDQRFADILSGSSVLHFESAEACYSVKVLKERQDLKVKFAVKAFTDVNKKDSAYSHGLYFSVGRQGDKSILYKAAKRGNGKDLVGMDHFWYEQPGYSMPQTEYGRPGLVQWVNDPSVNCMYWVRPKYRSELCIGGADSTDTLFLREGKLLRQSYENTNMVNGMASSPFFHFQEWKRYYRYNQNAVVDRKSWTTYVLTKEGALPLIGGDDQHTSSRVDSPLGIKPSTWRGKRGQLPPHPYCILPGPRKFPPVPPAPGCEVIISWRNSERVELLSGAPNWRYIDAASEVTLAITLQITARQAMHSLDAVLDIATANVEAWQGHPCVLVVHVAGATQPIADRTRERLQSIQHDGCLISLVAQERAAYVSRKALLNMAVDAAPTRWVVSGVELERGLIISSESAALCRRQVMINGQQRGQIFFLPQFAVTESEAETIESLSALDLLRWNQQSSLFVREPAVFEKDICEDEPDTAESPFSPLTEVWWKLTTAELLGVSMLGNEPYISKLAEVYSEIEKTIVADVMIGSGEKSLVVDSAPVLLFDSTGPYGIPTSTFVREVEEFGGKQCHNAFRLAQLLTLGYDLSVLPEAFVASTRKSREVALAHINEDAFGASRCDDCAMFKNEHEATLDTILQEERARVSKTAILLEGK